ncbi:MAG: uroporphyrinogen decarboxylase family protein [Promethearchaeota archaeon]|jgi:hypothetical protein
MSARKRVLQALNHEEPDQIPLFCQVIMPGFQRELLNYWGDSFTRDRSFKLSYRDFNLEQKLGFDMSWGFDSFPTFIPQKHMQEHPLPKLTDPNKYVDYHGRIFMKQKDENMVDAYYIGNYIDTEEKADYFHDTYFAIEWEEAPDFARNVNKRLKKFSTEEFVPCCHLDPILEPLWMGMGLGLLIKLIRKNRPKIIHYIKLRAKKLITAAKLNAETDFDVFFMCDDTALKNTTMINPKYHRELIIPAYKRAVQILKKAGKYICFHSDGFTEPYFEGLIEAGFNAVESLEPMAGMNLKHLKDSYGDKLCLIGNIDVSQLLPYGSKEDVVRAVKNCIRDAGEGGGYMLSACTDITNSCRLENVLTMISATKKYGVYPLNH